MKLTRRMGSARKATALAEPESAVAGLELDEDSAGLDGDAPDGPLAQVDADTAEANTTAHSRDHRIRLALTLCLPVAIALTVLAGWLAYQSSQARHAEQTQSLLVQTARQGATNLTTLSYTDVEAGAQRILDSSTGKFHDDFQSRRADFTNAVTSAKSTSVGTVTEAALQSQDGDAAKVLVAVAVKMSNADEPEQPPRTWRMRLDVQKVGDGARISAVEFVS